MKYNDYELIYMINEDEDAFSFLLDKYEPLFKKIAYSSVKRCASKGIDVDDLIQQCRITLCYVVDKYDYNRDVLFYTYLLVCLNRAIFNLSRKSVKQPECCYYMDFDNYENICEFVSDVNISFLIKILLLYLRLMRKKLTIVYLKLGKRWKNIFYFLNLCYNVFMIGGLRYV